MTTVFISYSWDSKSHKNRIKKFVKYLRKKQINVIFDEDIKFGERFPDFMEKGVSDSDYVLMCYTPAYKQKADGRLKNNQITGVGYENTMITAEIYNKNNDCKFIPILFEGTWEESTPYWAMGKFGADLTGKNIRLEISKLMETLDNNLTVSSNSTPSKTKSRKKIKFAESKFFSITTMVILATVATVIFGGNNLIERFKMKGWSNEDTQVSNDNMNEDYTESVADITINELLNKLWEDSNYIRSEYVKNLINSGIMYYNRGDFSCAGALFEQAIKEGDEGVTAKNNLSFMIRRQEYISENFKLHDLLEQCKENGGAFAIINYAMYLVSIDEWGEADSQFRMIKYSDPEIKECINWWKKLYNQGDCEGSLVLGWMLKYGFYEDEKRLVSDYFWDAKKYYENMPNFLYAESNSDHKYDVKYRLFEADFLSLNKTSHQGTVLENSNIIKSYLKNLDTGYIYDIYFFEDNYSSSGEGIPLYQYAVNFMGVDEGEYELYIEVQDYKPYLKRVLVNDYNYDEIILLQSKDKAFDHCFSLEVRNKEDGSFVEDSYCIKIGNDLLFASYKTSYEHTNLWVEYGTEISVICKDTTQTEIVTQKNQIITMYF